MIHARHHYATSLSGLQIGVSASLDNVIFNGTKKTFQHWDCTCHRQTNFRLPLEAMPTFWEQTHPKMFPSTAGQAGLPNLQQLDPIPQLSLRLCERLAWLGISSFVATTP